MRALLYVVCFTGLAATVAVVTGRVADPAITALLLVAVAAGTVAGGPGLLRRRAWPLALLLLPLGAYLLAKSLVPPPPLTNGVLGQLAFYANMLQRGAVAYARDEFPLAAAGQADLRLLLSLVVYSAIWAAAFLALSLRRPLPAVAILLVLAGFGFTADASARDLWSALAFVLLSGGMLALSRSLKRGRLLTTDALAGGATAALAVVLALSILGATTVEAGRPLRDWRHWNILGAGTSIFRFDFMQNYAQLLDPGENAVIMRVRSPVPSYWRANVLDRFDGSSWGSSGTGGPELQPDPSGADWVYELPAAHPAPPGRLVTQHFEIRGTYTDRLFAGGWATEVTAPLALDLRASEGTIGVTPPRGPTLEYSVTAIVPDLGPTDLIGRGRYYPRDVERLYTALPFPARRDAGDPPSEAAWRAAAAATPTGREWLDLYALNERIVGRETDPYRTALAIEQYLRSNYDYSLRPPSAGNASPYAEFLFATHTGYCQHFAGAMAVLLRFNGIPARVVVGFATGTETRSGIWTVTRNDAHAWVEAYFPDVGWAPFDPTPGRRIPSISTAPANGPDAAAAAGLTGASASPAAASALAARLARVADHGGPGAQTASAPAGAGRRTIWPLVVLILLVGWPVGRALARRRGLLRGSAEDRFEASVTRLYRDLRDLGVEVPSSQTLDETARYLRVHLGVDAADLPARLQAVAFGGRPATEADLEDLAALRRRVRRSVRAREGRLRGLLALYGIRLPAGHTTPLGQRVIPAAPDATRS